MVNSRGSSSGLVIHLSKYYVDHRRVFNTGNDPDFTTSLNTGSTSMLNARFSRLQESAGQRQITRFTKNDL